MITRILSLLFVAVAFCSMLWNTDMVSHYCEHLNLAADASDAMVLPMEKDSIQEVIKPTFMQEEKINHADWKTQVRIGYLLLRGF